ncbi:MAG: precorrin-2 C(20)-methyltransferase [Methanothermobacter wolfeii]|nr:precorrin-2 C(20)-methyltransferase [Methanothermobacter wolfeii]
MSGRLIGVGVGPGDSELLTLKAVRILKSVPVVCAPRSSSERESIALSIVREVLDERKDEYRVIDPVFPMTDDRDELERHWDEAADLVSAELGAGRDVAFITLGDPSIYSTFSYLQRRITERGFETLMVPGVTSFTACAASAGTALVEGDEILVVVPRIDERFERIVEDVDACVIMKTSRHGVKVREVMDSDPRSKDVVSVANCGMDDEVIERGFISGGRYLATTLVRFRGR